MTLSESIDRLRTRVEIDLESEVDLSDPHAATVHLIRGAQMVTRETSCLYEPMAPLTLTAGDQVIDMLGTQSGPMRIFRIHGDGIFINGNWLDECRMQEFYQANYTYQAAAQNDHPTAFIAFQDDKVLLDFPVSAVAAAASNIVRGWREHKTYTWADNENSQMEAPEVYHMLYIAKTALEITKSYSASPEGLQRRALIQTDLYGDGRTPGKIPKFLENNMSAFVDTRRQANAGKTRRVFVMTGYSGISGIP